MIRKTVIAAFVLALATDAMAQAMAKVGVTGWAKPPTRVEVFDKDGVQLGVRNFETVTVSGPYNWNQDYNLVEIQTGVWVGREKLISALCGKTAPPPTPKSVTGQVGGQAPRASTGFGSGNGCEPGR